MINSLINRGICLGQQNLCQLSQRCKANFKSRSTHQRLHQLPSIKSRRNCKNQTIVLVLTFFSSQISNIVNISMVIIFNNFSIGMVLYPTMLVSLWLIYLTMLVLAWAIIFNKYRYRHGCYLQQCTYRYGYYINNEGIGMGLYIQKCRYWYGCYINNEGVGMVVISKNVGIGMVFLFNSV